MKFAACFLSLSFLAGLLFIPIYENAHTGIFVSGTIETLTLRVAAKPNAQPEYTTYICDILASGKNGAFSKPYEKISLTHNASESPLSFGDCFVASCKITSPEPARNRGSFNYALSLKTKGIFCTADILDIRDKISSGNFTLRDRFTLLNIKLCESIDKNFSEENAILLKAILLGDKTDMPAEFYSELKGSGLSHIAAVSGMHLSYIVLLLSAFRKLFKINNRIFSCFILAFSFCFMLLTGMSSSVVRATIMIFCLHSSALFIRRSDSLTSLGIAALIITLNNPYASFSISFILSFTATAGILFLSEPLEKLLTPRVLQTQNKIVKKVSEFIICTASMSISATVFTIPIALSVFGEFSLLTLPANLASAPLLPVTLGAGFIFCLMSFICPALCPFIAKIFSVPVGMLKAVISFFGNIENGIIHSGKVTPIFIFIYILIMLILLFTLYKRYKVIIYFTVALFVAVCFSAYQVYTTHNIAEVSFINVGQGDSVLICLPENITCLIDGGTAHDDNPSSSCSYLMNKGITHLNFMVATHGNSDHIAGLLSVYDMCKVDTLLIPPEFSGTLAEALLEKAKMQNTKVITLTAGDCISFGENAVLRTLMPDKYTTETKSSPNDLCLMLRLEVYGTSFLFSGDANDATERYMLRLFPPDVLDADVYKVAHHGAKTASSIEFLNVVTPKYSVISSGKNTFGHPSRECIARLSDAGSAIFRTDTSNDIIFVLTTEGISNIIYN